MMILQSEKVCYKKESNHSKIVPDYGFEQWCRLLAKKSYFIKPPGVQRVANRLKIFFGSVRLVALASQNIRDTGMFILKLFGNIFNKGM